MDSKYCDLMSFFRGLVNFAISGEFNYDSEFFKNN
jgi:hypothetical protein